MPLATEGIALRKGYTPDTGALAEGTQEEPLHACYRRMLIK